ncbi:uncharacterized protein PGRI_023610 [Penicillium griseofulvum]|uniref:Rhodopsin domain-containing protein n=1 Tax=Penicillium patulum TaxID=5078 RepID=A0A135LHP2_PENPA|nr:uncharacterized protein PGRI_023610 [Penicillium griseofulvum]KXG48491.1 hypothetical protein PGRI_023610 [Penicillium griseofulvum]
MSVNITAVSWCFGGLALAVVSVRLYTRVVALQRAGWDDFFIAFSLASALVCSSLVQVAVSYGLGRHLNEISDASRQIQAIKYTVIAPNFSVISTTTGKISVTIFLLRLMGQSASAPRRWFLYILMVVSIAWNVLAIVAIIGFCRPAERIWNQNVDGSCFSLNFQLIAGISQAAFNAFNDLALALFPAYIFWHVQLASKMKFAIISVMGAGIFAAAATVVKCILLKNLPAHADITWSWADITIWYTIEMYVIIICASLPTLRQSYSVVLQRSRKSSAYMRSESTPRQKPIPLVRRAPDASLFATHTEAQADRADSRYSSQENILGDVGIRKTTEVRVSQEPRQDHEDSSRFPQLNPFRGPEKAP